MRESRIRGKEPGLSQRERRQRRLARDALAADDVVEGLALADEGGLAVLDQDFGCEGFAVVVAGHHVPVGAGSFEDEILADAGGGEGALADEASFLLREDVAGFAEGAADDDVASGPLLRAV